MISKSIYEIRDFFCLMFIAFSEASFLAPFVEDSHTNKENVV